MFPKNLLPEQFRESWCIAGGWAACPALASDMDVWVFGVATDKLAEVRQQLLDHLAAERKAKRMYYFEEGVETREVEGYDHPNQVQKVAEIFAPFPAKKIHLMVTDASAPGEIIAGFDISTHAVAITHTGFIYQSADYTAPHVRPYQLKATKTTTDRMAKICKRFGHPVPEVAVGEAN